MFFRNNNMACGLWLLPPFTYFLLDELFWYNIQPVRIWIIFHFWLAIIELQKLISLMDYDCSAHMHAVIFPFILTCDLFWQCMNSFVAISFKTAGSFDNFNDRKLYFLQSWEWTKIFLYYTDFSLSFSLVAP